MRRRTSTWRRMRSLMRCWRSLARHSAWVRTLAWCWCRCWWMGGRSSPRWRRSARVLRRDFTINGMLLDVDRYLASGDAAVAVLDYVGGREDLAEGVVRAIGKPMRRFTEDKLRMLRAVRFAARFGFTIERETFAAIRVLAGEIAQVSRERTRDELTRMLTEGRAAEAFKMLEATGLLQRVLPEVAAMRGVAQPPEWHPEGDVWVHTLLLLEKL